MRKPDSLWSRTLARLGFASDKKENRHSKHASRVMQFEPLERRQLLSVVTWTGLGSDNNWGTAANWSSGAAPVAGDELVFSGTTRTSSQNNLTAGTSFKSIEFSANNFTISGNSVTLTSGIIVDPSVTGTTVALSGIVLGGAFTVNTMSSSSAAISSAISGSYALAKSGSGTLSLTGTNSYSGGTTINAGVLQIGAGSTTGSIVGNIVDNGSLIVNRTGSLTLSGVISGSGSLTKSGSGTLILTGADSYSGGTTINAGVLQIGAGSTTGSIVGNIVDNGSLIVNRTGSLTLSGVISGSGSLTKSGSGTLILTGADSYSGGTTINAGVLQIGAGSTTGSIVGNITNNGSLIVNRTGSLALNGTISGGGAFTKQGSGNLAINGANAGFNGNKTISGGTVTLGHDWALGYGNLMMSGATLDLNGHGQNLAGLSGDSSSVILSNAGNATLSVWGGGDFNGSIQNGYGGVVSLLFDGAGSTLFLGNYNYFTGGTTVNNGTLQLDSDLALGYGNLMMNGGTLNLCGHDAFVYDLSGYGGVIMSSFSEATLYVSSGGYYGGQLIDDSYGYGGVLGLSVTGALTLSGENYLSGGTTINGGTLTMGNGLALGYGNLMMYGGTLNMADYDAFVYNLSGDSSSLITNSSGNSTLSVWNGGAFAGTIADGGGTTGLYSCGSLVLSGSALYSGGTTIASGSLQIGAGGTTGSISGDVVNNGNLIFNRSDNLTYSGVISGPGNVAKLGNGTLTLSGENYYSGQTLINGGTLCLGRGTVLGYGNVMMNGGTLDLAGYDVDLTSLYGDGNVVNNNETTPCTLTILGGGSFDGSISQGYGGAISLRATSGTLYLGGGNYYTGGTTIINCLVRTANAEALGYGAVTLVNSTLDLVGVNLNLYDDLAGDASSSIYCSSGNAAIRIANGSFNGRLRNYGSGVLAVVQSGGETTLSGANSYTGGTTVAYGTLKFGNATALGSGPIAVNSSGKLDLAGYAPTVVGLSGSGVIGNSSTTSNATLVCSGVNSFSGSIQDVLSGGTKKVAVTAANGALTLSGANSYTGGTTVASAGTLKLSAGSLVGSIANSGVIETVNTNALTVSASISGSGIFLKSGAGDVLLSGSNSFSGGTYLSKGLMTLGSNSALGAGSLTIDNDARLDLGGFNNSLAPLTTVLLADGYIVNGSLAASSSFNLQNGAISAVLCGAAGLVKSGAGEVTLCMQNTYLGSTIALAGTLVLSNGAEFPAGTTVSGPGAVTYAQVLYWYGGDGNWNDVDAWQFATGERTSWIDGYAAELWNGGTITVTGTISASALSFASGEFVITGGELELSSYSYVYVGSGETVIASDISGDGLLIKNGEGELEFTGTSEFTGVCRIENGIANFNFEEMPASPPEQWLAGDGEIIGPGSLQFYDSVVYDAVQARFNDKTIDRNEMIAILSIVAAQDATISAVELGDLRTVSNYASALNMLDYVKTALDYVANGNAANAKYQGATLGNLTAGDSSTKLTTLKNKWFLGTDRPVTDTGTYAYVAGSLVDADGFTWDDMDQGSEGDCWLIASLGAIADASPNAIGNMIINNGDGTWTVRFYYLRSGKLQEDYITVDQYLPTSSGNAVYAGVGGGLWIALIEKAYAQWCETGHAGRSSVNDYNSLYGGYYSEVFQAVTGNSGTYVSTTAQIINALDNGYAVGFSSLRSGVALSQYRIVSSHAYAITDYYYSATAGEYYFVLRNPWGWYQPDDVLASDLRTVLIANANLTTPAAETLASAGLFSSSGENVAASQELASISSPMSAQLKSDKLRHAIPMSWSESPLSRFSSSTPYDASSDYLTTISEGRAYDFASRDANFANMSFKEDALANDSRSEWDSTHATFISADPLATSDISRQLRTAKKLNAVDGAIESVFADEEIMFALI